MGTQTVLVVFQMNVGENAQSQCHIVKLIEMMFVDIHASKTVVGRRESIQEFIEISEQSKL
jgi:hypothetical protein